MSRSAIADPVRRRHPELVPGKKWLFHVTLLPELDWKHTRAERIIESQCPTFKGGMMSGNIELLIPAGEHSYSPGQSKPRLAPRLDSMAGKTIGILSNSWQCMTVVTDEFRNLLMRDFGVKEVIRFDSPLTLALPEHLMKDAVERCDAAIVGMGT